MSHNITVRNVIDQVISLAKEYPEAKYYSEFGCYYHIGKVTDGPEEEGCVFGQALRKLGFKNEQFCGSIIADVFCYLNIESDAEPAHGANMEYSWCQSFQFHQDQGHCWGDILEQLGECDDTKKEVKEQE